MIRILFLFMMFCIIGWLWETPWVSLKTKKFVNRGFLHGPYIPIYGFAVITIILSMTIFDTVNQNNVFMIIIQIIYGTCNCGVGICNIVGFRKSFSYKMVGL